MNKFEIVSKYKGANLELPKRATKSSAGYDFTVAKDTIIHPYDDLMRKITRQAFYSETIPFKNNFNPRTLNDVKQLTKSSGAKPTLVPTGIKCNMDKNMYLELSVRSSTPLNYWLILANGVGK